MKTKYIVRITLLFILCVSFAYLYNIPQAKIYRLRAEHLRDMKAFLDVENINFRFSGHSTDYIGNNIKGYEMLDIENGYSKTIDIFNSYIDTEKYSLMSDWDICIFNKVTFNAPYDNYLILTFDENMRKYVPIEVFGYFCNAQSFGDIANIPGIEHLEKANVDFSYYAVDNYKSFDHLGTPYLKKMIGLKHLELSKSSVNLEFLTETQKLESLILTDCVMCRDLIKIKDAPSLKYVELNLQYITDEEYEAIQTVINACPEKNITLNCDNIITEDEQQALYEQFLEEFAKPGKQMLWDK